GVWATRWPRRDAVAGGARLWAASDPVLGGGENPSPARGHRRRDQSRSDCRVAGGAATSADADLALRCARSRLRHPRGDTTCADSHCPAWSCDRLQKHPLKLFFTTKIVSVVHCWKKRRVRPLPQAGASLTSPVKDMHLAYDLLDLHH